MWDSEAASAACDWSAMQTDGVPPYSGERGMQLGKTRFAFRNGWRMRLRGNDSRSALTHPLLQSCRSHSFLAAGDLSGMEY